ncbi:hypothetical protein ZEAMMB73_Zm00001d000448 [Zea mays]|uniref:Uncharacterized protein n=1 Tax=Zea mays TaxID=4577 RepID=A0A1D6Q289_MAIZE|nr:hypothetical protein ZEAMMB73_Zm00001d050573 [Zea mays]ONM62936.1 hypothetical protein ZEAMMB73_Zm00001d000448 [Zea mays]
MDRRTPGFRRGGLLDSIVASASPPLPLLSCGREWMIFHIPIGLSLVLEFKLGGVKMENVYKATVGAIAQNGYYVAYDGWGNREEEMVPVTLHGSVGHNEAIQICY